MKINKAELARILDINIRTLHNWEKNRPKLFNFIINCYKENNNNNDNISISEKDLEIIKCLNELDDEEKNLYYHEIKARALRKKLG